MGVTTDYIAQYQQDVADSTSGTGLFPSVMMAQAILESNNGKSLLASKYNNHFGIKKSGLWLGGSVNLPTTEEVNGTEINTTADFRTYNTAFDGFVDRNNFLKQNSRYANAGVFAATTPEQQAQSLLDAGYATESDYASSLIQLINQFNLKALDNLPVNKFRMTTNTKILIAGGAFIVAAFVVYRITRK